jgi:hypothetical protein
LIKYILNKVSNAKILIIGGSNDVCKAVYDSNVFDNIIHLDSMVDVKSMFKMQIQDRDAKGKFVFDPSYHEHHKSYLRNIFTAGAPLGCGAPLEFFNAMNKKN